MHQNPKTQGAVTLCATERYRKITVRVDSWGLGASAGRCTQDYYGIYFASTQVSAAPLVTARAMAPRKVRGGRGFTYRVVARPQMGSDAQDLAFRMQLPANVTLKGFHSKPKLTTAPVVDETGQLTWRTPLKAGKAAKLALKLQTTGCHPAMALNGYFYKADEPVHQGTAVPIMNTVRASLSI